MRDKKEMCLEEVPPAVYGAALCRALRWACALELTLHKEEGMEAQGADVRTRQGSRAIATRLHIFPQSILVPLHQLTGPNEGVGGGAKFNQVHHLNVCMWYMVLCTHDSKVYSPSAF